MFTPIEFKDVTQPAVVYKEKINGFLRDGSQLHIDVGSVTPLIVNFKSLEAAVQGYEDLKKEMAAVPEKKPVEPEPEKPQG